MTNIKVFPKWLPISALIIFTILVVGWLGIHYIEFYTNSELINNSATVSRGLYEKHQHLIHTVLSLFFVFSSIVLGAIGLRVYKLLKECDERYNFYESVLNYIPVPIFFKNLDGTYKYCNTAFYNDLGKMPKEVLGKKVRSIYKNTADEETINNFIASDIRILRTLSPEVEFRELEDGRGYMVQKGVYRDNKGNVTGIIGVATNFDNIKEVMNKEK